MAFLTALTPGPLKVTVLAMLALYLGRMRHLSSLQGARMLDELRALPDAMRRAPTVEAALMQYEEGRREEVEKTQHAADVSLVWFEHVDRFWDFDPVQFAFGVMTRAKAITYDNLTLRAPDFVSEVDKAFARQVRAKGLEVDVVELAARVMARAVTAEISEFFQSRHTAAGIRIHLGVQATSIEGDGFGVRIGKQREGVAGFLTKIARLLRRVDADRNRLNAGSAEIGELLYDNDHLTSQGAFNGIALDSVATLSGHALPFASTLALNGNWSITALPHLSGTFAVRRAGAYR